MKLGILVGYSQATMDIPMDLILEGERLGYDSAWTSEAYGSDAVSPAAWILAQTSTIKVGTAIMQLPARSPTSTAMTAMTLDKLSGGRFLLGLGPSGPQVAEGWYGQAYGKPMARMREYVTIIRKILARDEPLTHTGTYYEIPYRGEGSSGLGKPLKSILHGDPAMKIYSAAITPAGVRLAAEIADGFFPLWMNPERFDVFEGSIQQGFDKASGAKSLDNFDVAAFVDVSMGDDIDACRLPIKQKIALYVGGMGARGKNFYTDYTKRLGYEDAAVKIQDLFLAGNKREAVAAVPDELVDECNLVGPAQRIRERLQIWKEAGKQGRVGSMLLGGASVDALRVVAEEVL